MEVASYMFLTLEAGHGIIDMYVNIASPKPKEASMSRNYTVFNVIAGILVIAVAVLALPLNDVSGSTEDTVTVAFGTFARQVRYVWTADAETVRIDKGLGNRIRAAFLQDSRPAFRFLRTGRVMKLTKDEVWVETHLVPVDVLEALLAARKKAREEYPDLQVPNIGGIN